MRIESKLGVGDRGKLNELPSTDGKRSKPGLLGATVKPWDLTVSPFASNQ
jgi:hypothetical protein